MYLESLQDLLAPEKTNIPIVEDPKTGEVSLPGAAVVDIRNLDHFVELLQIGEANRHAANTKLNTESSRSHAMLVVRIGLLTVFVLFQTYSQFFMTFSSMLYLLSYSTSHCAGSHPKIFERERGK